MKLVSKSGTALQRQACIFAHYSHDGSISHSVRWYLSQLATLNISVLLISTAPRLDHASIDAIRSYCHSIYLRANIGYDFGSFREGLNLILGQSVELVVLANDSVYGPFKPIKSIIDYGIRENLDIWSATDSHEIDYHLQSYFMVVRGDIARTERFQEIWMLDDITYNSLAALPPQAQREIAITNYEVKYSQRYLNEARFRIGAVFSFEDVVRRATEAYLKDLKQAHDRPSSRNNTMLLGPNPMQYLWHTLMAHMDFPFIKRDLIERNPLGLPRQHDWLDCLSPACDSTLALCRDLSDKGLKHLLYRIAPIQDKTPSFIRTAELHHNLSASGLFSETLPVKFDDKTYLRDNPDVLTALADKTISSGWDHYLKYGFLERRAFPFTT